MEEITLKDLASDNVKLLTVFDIINIEDVNSIKMVASEGKRSLTINVGLYNQLFNDTAKKLILNKIKTDLNLNGYIIRFGI